MFMSYYLDKFLKLCVSQKKKKFFQYLFLTVNISSNELIVLNLVLIQQVLFKVFLKVERILFRVPISWFLSKKRKLIDTVTHCHSMSLVVIRWHSLSLTASLVVTRCATRCTNRYHSLSLDVSFVCHFINDQK